MRDAAAWVGVVFALGLPTSAAAGPLQPDPPTTPAPVGLQPDTFPSAATAPAREEAAAPVTHVTPVTHVAPVTAGAVAPSLATPPAEKPPTVLAPVDTPVVPAVTHIVVQHAQTRSHRAAARRRAVPRIRLPVVVGATSTMRIGLLAPASAVRMPAVLPNRRHLGPAALALLAFVVTSGCFLAVVARSRRDGIGS